MNSHEYVCPCNDYLSSAAFSDIGSSTAVAGDASHSCQ